MKILISKITIALFLSFSLFSSSCKKEPASETLPSEPVPISLSADQISTISSENSFAIDIFRNVLLNDHTNVIISPLSISCALSMTLNGANGSTRSAMVEALRMQGLTPEIINNSYKGLINALLNIDKRVLINIANSVWTEKNFVVKKPFIDILTGYYNAEAKSFSITDPQAPAIINTWIENKTNGLIKNMLESLDENTAMLLINAIYFKGKWTSQFDKGNTVNASFNKFDGSQVQVQMMKQKAGYKIFKGEGFIFAEFPYGQGNYVMDVFLPDNQMDFAGTLSLINENNLKEWTDHMTVTMTDLSFPRFKYGFKKELKDILTKMGMGIAFSDNADLSNISDRDLYISFVLHQAFIETNEEGTVAAAATIVGINTTSAPAQPFILNIDHPFLYFIRETTTNSIIFMGKVEDPTAQ